MIEKVISCWGKSKLKDIIQIRLAEDKDLLTALYQAVKELKIESGVILSGVGALSSAVCRNLIRFPATFPITDQDRLFYELKQPLELTSLSGWIAPKKDGSTEIHAHFTVSGVIDGKVIGTGGHLTTGTTTSIKVVIAIGILESGACFADFAESSQQTDIFF